MQDELRPCPFCGGVAEMRKSPMLSTIRPGIEGMSGGELSETGRYGYFVTCAECGITKKRMGYNGAATKSWESEDAAIAAWNRRADPKELS